MSFALVAASALVLSACQDASTSTTAAAPAPAAVSHAAVRMAPDFTLMDASGQARSLADFRGKVVVLEWTNEGCPFVQKHYASGTMQATQKAAVADGVVWLTLVSSAPGREGHLEGERAQSWASRTNAGSSHLLLDPSGDVGHAFGAATTPDMRVINEKGEIIYTGAIDDRPSANPASLDGAKNLVKAALEDHKAGRKVATPFAQPYGCTVKYTGDI